MVKLSLEIEEDFEFDLIGICCHIKDYRLSWEINRQLGISLKKENDLELNVKDLSQSFSFYEFLDEDNHLEYFLINNRSDNGYLLPEEKSCDYMLLVKGSIGETQKNLMIQKISGIKFVLTSYGIDVKQLKSKKNLLF